MKSVNILIAIMIMTAVLSSCNKELTNDFEEGVMTKSSIVNGNSTPISFEGITPVIISGANKGGNRTCSEVASAFNTSFALCGEKLDYGDFNLDGTYEFNGTFPEGLEVTVNGIYISFELDNCLSIDGAYYKVGAVIVKGGASANIYYYPNGTTSDSGLAAPGDKFMVSNLTFCFVPCEPAQEYVIAVKSWYWTSFEAYTNQSWSDYKYTMSTGDYVFTTGDWCDMLGVNYYPSSQEFLLTENTGTVKIEEGWPAGIHSLIVTVDLNEGMIFDFTALYFGNMEGLLNGALTSSGCPIYSAWPFQKDLKENTHIFTIPFEAL